jgi:predicted TPR repeat methyltransferase
MAEVAVPVPVPVRMSLWDALEQAQKFQRTENLPAAEHIYLEVLSQLPDEANTLNFLGILRHQQGRTDEAVELLRRTVTLLPGDAGPLLNLGNVLIEAERFEEAAEALRLAVDIDPASAVAYNNFGIACMRCDDIERSEAAFVEALRIDPERSDVHFNYARLLHVTGRLRESAAHSIRALTIDPNQASARKLLSMAYFVLGERDKAVDNLREWKELEPDSPEIDHHLAACGGSEVPERASDVYVQHVFDGFAASFDKKLHMLGYRAPELIGRALSAVAPLLPTGAAILDAGCGTGLCGPLLKPHAQVLDGVDLSKGMLDKATAHPEYTALFHAELTAYLQQSTARYDAIVSADTLCYFGDLNAFLAAAHQALRGPALLIFSLEALKDDAQDYHLHIHGRYSHSRAYVQRSLAANGFELRTIDEDILRQELIESVHGWIVTAQRCAPASGA